MIPPPQPQRKSLGVNMMKINTNGRLIAVAWENGFILIYDIELNPPMLIAATRECMGKSLVDFQWPLDGGSSFITLTDDG